MPAFFFCHSRWAAGSTRCLRLRSPLAHPSSPPSPFHWHLSFRDRATGKLIRYLVENGTFVGKGQAIAEIEVMKMYVTMSSPESGVARFTLPEGTVLRSGDVIGRLDLASGTKYAPAPALPCPVSFSLPCSALLLLLVVGVVYGERSLVSL